ncbi:MAG: ankyrin repeat domain-containing protein [Planctomycetota bacterium]
MENKVNQPQLITRRRHYFYVLVFSVAAWLFVAAVIGGFFPVYIEWGICMDGSHCIYGGHTKYLNVNFLILGVGGIFWGFVFSFVLNRFMLVANAKPDDRQVPFSLGARYGRAMLRWRGLISLLIIFAIYFAGDYIAHRSYAVDPTYTHGMPEQHCAVIRNDLDDFRSAIKHCADVNEHDRGGNTALHWSAFLHCSDDFASLLLQAGAKVDPPDRNGNTPLHWAVKEGRKSTVALLIDGGANIEARTRLGQSDQTPLLLAAEYGWNDIVRLLVEKGADRDARDEDGWKALHFAAEDGNDELALFLMELGEKMDVETTSGDTPLHIAARNGRLETVRMLVLRHAAVDAVNKCDQTPLHLAVKRGRLEVIKFLLENGADIEHVDGSGYTPLSEAALFRQKAACALLIEKGADLNYGKVRWSVLMCALRPFKRDIASLLIEKGADVNAVNPLGRTLLDLYRIGGCQEGVDFLRRHGAKTGAELKAEKAGSGK